jgi:coenzyme F420-reducing hydrogenase beta subunit
MASWMLEKLIAENIVDEVACISPVEDKDKLFQYGFFNDPESIRNCAKSAYYPVEISRLLQEMRKNNKRYAVIGLPCYLKALKLATKRIHNLRGKIIITLGLVCEQTKSKHYTTYLAALAGTNKNLKKVVYRGKSLDQPAYNYYFQYINEDNEEGKLFWHEGVSEAWDNRWFTPNACNYCDDVFAEVADVTFMDAWLPEYSKDGRGTNLIISRSLVIRRLFDEGKNDKQILIETIPIKKVIESQLDGLYNKKKAIAYRLHLANMKGLRVPSKRVLPSQHAVHFVSKKIIAIKSEMQHSSKILFASHNQNDKLDTIAIRTSMSPLVRAIKRWSRLRNILLIPQRAWRRAGRLLIGN